eukprot:311964_1
MAYNYLVTAQPATVVSNSHTGYFNSENELNTLLIRSNNIEVYTLNADDGFEKVNELPFYGRIIQSLMFRPPRCTTDHLFLLTQSFAFCIVATDPSTNQIITKASGQLKEENASIKSSSQSLISIDSAQQNILVHIYKGEVLLIELDEFGQLKQRACAEKIIIHELEILSLTFLHSTHDHSSSNDTTSNAMQVDDTDDNHNTNNTNNKNNDLSAPLITTTTSTKSKASQVLKSKLNRLKSTKMKMKSLRKRSRSSSESKTDMNEDTNEEKEALNTSKCKLLLCVLYQDYRKGRHIKTYYLNTALHELQDGPWDTLMVEEGCNKLIAVPPPLRGVLFIGQYSIAYRNGDNCQRVQVPDGDLCCHDAMDSNGTRWLIGDALNRSLNLLEMSYSEEEYKVSHLQFNALGSIVSPCTISYICSGLCFIGSTVGDSQLIEIHSEEDSGDTAMEESKIEVVEELSNLGPIVDLVSVDLERQGQCQLVTCSGVGRDGSLRVIKNGIGIECVAEIAMEGIQGLWGLRSDSSSVFDSYLITSFISETRVLAMTDEGLEEMEMSGLNASIRTVHCHNMCCDTFCQIGASEINLIGLEKELFALKYSWKCADGVRINCCATNEVQLLCALSNGDLVLLEVQSSSIVCVKCVSESDEISCVALSPTFESVNANKSLYGAVGVWKDYSIRILSMPDLNIILTIACETDTVPRSVLITNFGSGCDEYLFVGMGDGSLIEAKLRIKLTRYVISHIELVAQKCIPLGTQPVCLVPFQCNDICYIFGGCDRPTVIYLVNNRMFYANVNLAQINCMTQFNAQDLTDCLAMSCDGNLMIGQMDEVQKLHMTKIELDEQPRRIAYHSASNCYLLASQMNNEYKLTLRDGHNIEDVSYTAQLDPYWNVTKIITHRFACDPHVTYFVITSCLAKPHERAPTQGKLQVAMVMASNQSGNQLKIVHTALFRGDPACVRGIGDDYLLVGVRSKIQLFRWMLSSDSDYPFELQHLHTIHNNTFVLDMKVHGDFFIVIDLMKSISMFLLHQMKVIDDKKMIDGTMDSNKKEYAATITEVARDYDPSWMKCGEMYNDQYLVGVDSFCNLFILKRNIDSLNEEERGRLDVVCRIHCGDDINTICHGSLVMDIAAGDEDEEKESVCLRKCVFGTIDGSIGVLISIPYARYDVLHKLEKSLNKFVQGLGGLHHDEWRKFKNQTDAKQAVGFLDGDLIETFLNLTNQQQTQIAQDIKIDIQSLTQIVEEMNRLH